MHANCLGMPSAVIDDVCFLITYDHMVFLGNVGSWLPATPHAHPLRSRSLLCLAHCCGMGEAKRSMRFS